MRAASVLILLFIVFRSHAEGFVVFEKDGLFGIKEVDGQVTVPAVYDKLGWSDDTQVIRDGLIGFRENNSWGLISVRNKILAEARFYSLEPFENELIKAAIKGKFSNQLFYGLLDESGKTVVGFNYFTLSPIGKNLLVSQYNKVQRHGILTYSNELIIPVEYKSVQLKGNMFFAFRFDEEFDLYTTFGSSISQGLDSLRQLSAGFVGYQNGYAGFINDAGQVEYPYDYKNIEVSESIALPVPFADWEIYRKDELLFKISADSLEYFEFGLWKTFLNGAHHLVSLDSTIQLKDFFLMGVTDNSYLLKDSRSAKWKVLSKRNEEILSGYDSICAVKYGFWAQKDGYWNLFNRYGSKKNRFQFQDINEGLGGQFLVKLNEYWGILDALGDQVTPFKYDGIQPSTSTYIVDYLGRQGVMDKSGNWEVKAEFAQVATYGELFVGRKGYSYSYFKDGMLVNKSTLKPEAIVGEAILVKGDSLWGLLDQSGIVIVDPLYESISWRNGYYELSRDGLYVVLDQQGRTVYNSLLGIQQLVGYSEDYYLVKKNNRWGFLDFAGRLRISNRYDSAQLFSEGLAPILINRKWGFIDKDEALIIQPYYQEVGSFKKGHCIVRGNGGYGLLDSQGNEVVQTVWQRIESLPTDNYLLIDQYNKMGLVSHSGKILLRPTFDSLVDLGNKVLVTSNGKKGILAYSGEQLLKLNYKVIKISGDYTILKY